MPKLLKPIVFGVDDTPPFIELLLMGVQHLVKFGLLIILPISLAQHIGLHGSAMYHFISLTLIGSAITTLLMANKRGIGAHCFIPAIASISYFACLLSVASSGKLSQVLGASIIIALAQTGFSFLFPLLRRFFTLNLAGLGLFSLGIWAAVLGVSEFFHPIGLGQVIIHGLPLQTGLSMKSSLLGLAVVIVIMPCLFFRKWCAVSILIGLTIGWIAGSLLGLTPTGNIALFHQAPWFILPSFFHAISFNFSWQQVVIFCFVGFYASFVFFSVITVIAHENESHWRENSLTKVRSGNLAAGIGALMSTLLGGMPSSPIPGAVGDMITTRAYSRSTAYVYSLLIFVLAFFPKLAFTLVTIPAAANGAVILIMGGMMCTKGLSFIAFQAIPAKTVKALSYAILLTVLTNLTPSIFQLPFLRYFTDSSVLVGLVTFLVLNSIFSLRHCYDRS